MDAAPLFDAEFRCGPRGLFEDPDGIRLEVNLVPDAGLLAALWSDPDLTRTMEV